jgi:hypothetical protein
MRAIEALRVVLGLDLNPADKLTLMAIIHSIDWETWRGLVSIKRLSGMSRVSTASIKRALASLTEKKLIDRERHMTRYGEASAVTIVNVENLNDFAVAHDEPTLAHSEPTLAHGEPTLAHGDTSMAHSEPTLAHGDTSMAHGEPPLSVLPVVSSVSPVHQSVDKPVERPVVMTPPPSETPRAETAAAPRWRTIPQAQRYSHQVIYYKLLDGLGYAPKQILHLRNVLQDALIYPDQQDIQAFLLTYEH